MDDAGKECAWLTPMLNVPAFVDGMLKSHPVVPTASTPVYSNAAFQLLGYVLEEMTNKTYQKLLQDDLLNQLDLARSSYSAPRDEHGIIPDGGAMFWNLDLGDETP
jgi:CubicO group peptidase (beta-lactamase class C family)